MVKQGDIISVDLSPTKGREQQGYRPALVISNTKYKSISGFVLACPITSKTKLLHIRVGLDQRTKTQGDILCEQVRIIDLQERQYNVIENVPLDIFQKVYSVINSLIAPTYK
ncbi:MAG: type II toxin-antitoxin system PemK/MazF family toxin [Oscillospiraceae bacterium]|jgi:mRNA-degrading endonuclease toxin of MazEF toxin-antitoxin module|nr:type II toxin-antitoxin system PemK/MazF family toxin [Oscillospiraceae bacterium]